MFGTAFYLGGDSYPACVRAEQALDKHVSTHFAEWIGQVEILRRSGVGERVGSLADRIAFLETLLSQRQDRQRTVLIGRSSGARVVTLVAARQPVGAVICLAYPFRHPDHPPTPLRVAHLADLTTPTLIIQGRNDPYGGSTVTSDFPLSGAIRVHLVNADHQLKLGPPGWETACRVILDFLHDALGEA